MGVPLTLFGHPHEHTREGCLRHNNSRRNHFFPATATLMALATLPRYSRGIVVAAVPSHDEVQRSSRDSSDGYTFFVGAGRFAAASKAGSRSDALAHIRLTTLAPSQLSATPPGLTCMTCVKSVLFTGSWEFGRIMLAAVSTCALTQFLPRLLGTLFIGIARLVQIGQNPPRQWLVSRQSSPVAPPQREKGRLESHLASGCSAGLLTTISVPSARVL